MRLRYALTDEPYERLKPPLPGKPGDPGRTAADNRLVLDAVLWGARTGAPWADLPERFGNYDSVYQRFNRWARRGRWEAIFEALQEPDAEWLMLDSTVVRAHPHARESAPARCWGEKGGRDARAVAEDDALGRSRGGVSTGVHAACDALGNPLAFALTGGQRHDVTQAGLWLDAVTLNTT